MKRIGALLVGMGWVAIAQAAAPLATDDAGVLEARACEAETYAQRLREDGADPVRGVSATFGCGIGARSQVGIGYARASSAGTHDDAVGILGKIALLTADDAAPLGLALAWRLTALRTSGSGLRQEGSALTLIASRPLTPGITAHANLGFARSRAAQASSTTWGLAAEAAIGAGVEALAEVYGDDRSRPWRGVGARWSPTPRASFGIVFAQQSAQPRSRSASVGLKLGF